MEIHMRGSMCLLIFIRISAATLRGRRKMPCNFTETKSSKISSHWPIDKIFLHHFVWLGFAIEYNDWPKLNKKKGGKKKKNGGEGVDIVVCLRKSMQIPEN